MEIYINRKEKKAVAFTLAVISELSDLVTEDLKTETNEVRVMDQQMLLKRYEETKIRLRTILRKLEG